MRRMAGLLFAGGLAAGLGAGMTAIARNGGRQRWQFSGGRFAEVSNTSSGLCIGFPAGGPPVTGARLVQERCDQVPPWQQVRQSRDGNDRTPLVAASCQGFGNAAEILELG
jgi:hypothetical protein